MSVHTAAAAAMVSQVNGFRTHLLQLRQGHHEGSPDSGMLKSLYFSNFWTFQNKNSDLFNVCFSYLIKMLVI